MPDFVLGPWWKAPCRAAWVLRWGAHYSCAWRDGSRLWHYNGAAGSRVFTSVPIAEEPELPAATDSSLPASAPAAAAQLGSLQARVEALHSSGLITEPELFAVEDVIADYIAEAACAGATGVDELQQRVRRLVDLSEVAADDHQTFAASVRAETTAPLAAPAAETANVQEAETGEVLVLIQRRPVQEELADDSEIHVLWAPKVGPAIVQLEPEPEPNPELQSNVEGGEGDKWYCASCFQGGLTWAPNWNASDTIRCGACDTDRPAPTDRSAWVPFAELSTKDQASARRQWASKWQQVVWATCGPRWQLTGAASDRIHL